MWYGSARYPFLPYDEAAARTFEMIKRKESVGTMDLKIAAIFLANEVTLPTRNLSDFQRVPNLRAEDWSV